MGEACSDGIRTLIEAVVWPIGRLSDLLGGNQCGDADDVFHSVHGTGENIQRHFCGHVFQSSHLEVRGAHPGFDRADEVLNGHNANGQLSGITVHLLLHPFQNVFVFPATDAVFLAVGALRLHRFGVMSKDRIGPYTTLRLASFAKPAQLFEVLGLILSVGVAFHSGLKSVE